MSVKLLILKSYEDVIAKVEEKVSPLGELFGYILEDPYLVRLEEETETLPARVTFYPYAPLSKDSKIKIPSDWVVSVVEPLDEVKNSYLEKVNDQTVNADERSDSNNSD
jgi:hypothetical protein